MTCFNFNWYGIFFRSKRSCQVVWRGPCSWIASSRRASCIAVSYASSCALSRLQCRCSDDGLWPTTVEEEEDKDGEDVIGIVEVEVEEVFVLFMMAVMASWRFYAISANVRPPRKIDCWDSTLFVGVTWASNSFAIFTSVLLRTWHISWIQCVSVNGTSTVAWMVAVSWALRWTSCVELYACTNNVPPPVKQT